MKETYQNLYLDDEEKAQKNKERYRIKVHEDWLCRYTYVKEPTSLKKKLIRSRKNSVSESEESSDQE